MTDGVRETFLVAFPGELVECDSLDDATALKSARDLMADLMGCDPSPEDCERLVGESIHFHRPRFGDPPAYHAPVSAADYFAPAHA